MQKGFGTYSYAHIASAIPLEAFSVHSYGHMVPYATIWYYMVAYGNNGIDPTCTVKVKGDQEVCDISRMIEKLNMEHEQTKK